MPSVHAEISGPGPLGIVFLVEVHRLSLLEMVEVDDPALASVEEHFLAIGGLDESESAVLHDLLDRSTRHRYVPYAVAASTNLGPARLPTFSGEHEPSSGHVEPCGQL